MPVLLLCYGDKEAKDLLRLAIEARYGINPPVIESLCVEFKGRARVKVGPITTWVPVDARASFVLPDKIRWDFTVKPLRLPVQHGSEAYDGEEHRSLKKGIITDEALMISMRRRLGAIAAMLLTPLSDMSIKLTAIDERCFAAEHTKEDDTVTLCVREDHSLAHTQVTCINPDTEKEQTFTLRLSEEQAPVDELMLPVEIKAFWDDNPYFEVKPNKVEVNPDFAEGVFTLADTD